MAACVQAPIVCAQLKTPCAQAAAIWARAKITCTQATGPCAQAAITRAQAIFACGQAAETRARAPVACGWVKSACAQGAATCAPAGRASVRPAGKCAGAMGWSGSLRIRRVGGNRKKQYEQTILVGEVMNCSHPRASDRTPKGNRPYRIFPQRNPFCDEGFPYRHFGRSHRLPRWF